MPGVSKTRFARGVMGENVRSSLIRVWGAGVEGQKLGVGLTVLLAQNNSRLDSNEEERSASSLIFRLINDSDQV